MSKKAYSFRLEDDDYERLTRVAEERFLGNRTALVEAALRLAAIVYGDPTTYMQDGRLVDPTDASQVLAAFLTGQGRD